MNLRGLIRPAGRLLQILALKSAWQPYRRHAFLAYLRFLWGLRRGLIGFLLALFFLQTMVIGFVGSGVFAVLLATDDPRARLWGLLVVFAALFIVPIAVLTYLLSDRVWFRLSGAEKKFETLFPKSERSSPDH